MLTVKSKVLLGVMAVSLVLLFAEGSRAAEGPGPLDLIQSGTDKALEILHSKGNGGPTLRERRAEILTIVDKYFNFHEMARRALGRPWKDQTTAKQQEFVSLFKQLLFNTYVDRVQSYTTSDEKVAYDSQKVDGDYATVKTRILGYKSGEVNVDYRLRREEGAWKVYDVVVEGVSFVENYRNQFSAILSGSSFDSLLDKMRQKVAEQKGA